MKVAAIILAAGSSRRMGGANKLVATIGGKPIVRIVVEAALASRTQPVVLVTGHGASEVGAAVSDLPVHLARNANHAMGLSSSLRAGLAALPADAAGVAVLLADMPAVDGPTLDRLVATFIAHAGAAIVVPTASGQRGNPVIWPAHLFAVLAAVEGDRGGRTLLDAHHDAIVAVECGPVVALDVDDPADLAALGGEFAV
jgi:molybdenum cofactor cytidylyltransferase